MTDVVARALAMQAMQGKGVNQYKSSGEFPTIGKAGGLYIDNIKNQVYYWNEDTLSYVLLISGDQDVPTEVSKVLDEQLVPVLEETLSEVILTGGTSID
jgi:hypothetical protein